MIGQEILDQYKLSIEQDIKELLQEKNISDIFEIEAFTKKYKENFVVGFKKGKAEGIEIGEARLREEKIEIAIAMLLDGDSVEKIARITGLSILEIEKLNLN